MPPLADLVGRRFGSLVVVEPAGRKSGKRQWRVVCDCGIEETVPGYRLPYRPSHRARRGVATKCSECRRQRTCKFCGKKFLAPRGRADYCEPCKPEAKKAYHRNFYHRKATENPGWVQEVVQKQRARRASDPEAARRYAESMQRARAKVRNRYKEDPAFRAEMLRQSREGYAKNAPARRARRAELKAARLRAMTREEYEEWKERERAYQRRWRRAWRKRLATDPERLEEYKEKLREWRRRKALRDLFAVGTELLNRRKDTE